jgi:hypothetical protein
MRNWWPSAHQVGGIDVAMHDVKRMFVAVAQRVCVVQGLRRLPADERRQRRPHPPPGIGQRAQHDAEVFPLHVLHGQERRAIDVTEVVDLDDVGVVQQGGDLGLVAKLVQELGRAGERSPNALDDHHPPEPLGPDRDGAEHVRHTTGPQALEQGVATEVLRVGAPVGKLFL